MGIENQSNKIIAGMSHLLLIFFLQVYADLNL